MLPTDPCALPDEPESCGALFDMGEAILDVLTAALEPFDDPAICGDCTGITGYVAHGDPTIPFSDVRGALLTVHLQQYAATSTSMGRFNNAAMPGAALLTFEASWRIELRESCYPGPEVVADQPTFPSTELLHEVNRHLYAHGFTAYKALYAAWANKTLFPDATQCPDLRFGALLPISPQAYMAGWSWDVTGPVP